MAHTRTIPFWTVLLLSALLFASFFWGSVDARRRKKQEGCGGPSASAGVTSGSGKVGANAGATAHKERVGDSDLSAGEIGISGGGSIDKTGMRAKAEAEANALRMKGERYDVKVGNAEAGAKAGFGLDGVGAKVSAGVNAIDAKAGGVRAKVGLGVDSGAHIGPDGIDVSLLGTGVKLGKEIGVSVLGTELSFNVKECFDSICDVFRSKPTKRGMEPLEYEEDEEGLEEIEAEEVPEAEEEEEEAAEVEPEAEISLLDQSEEEEQESLYEEEVAEDSQLVEEEGQNAEQDEVEEAEEDF